MLPLPHLHLYKLLSDWLTMLAKYVDIFVDYNASNWDNSLPQQVTHIGKVVLFTFNALLNGFDLGVIGIQHCCIATSLYWNRSCILTFMTAMYGYGHTCNNSKCYNP